MKQPQNTDSTQYHQLFADFYISNGFYFHRPGSFFYCNDSGRPDFFWPLHRLYSICIGETRHSHIKSALRISANPLHHFCFLQFFVILNQRLSSQISQSFSRQLFIHCQNIFQNSQSGICRQGLFISQLHIFNKMLDKKARFKIIF